MADETTTSSLRAIVRGRVQGVYFRAFAREAAERLGLKGYAMNLEGGDSVEVCAEGSRDALERLVQLLRKGPPGARVDAVDSQWREGAPRYSRFEIRY